MPSLDGTSQWISKNTLILPSFDRFGCNFHPVANIFFNLAIFWGHYARPGLRGNGLQTSKIAKSRKSVVFSLYMGVVEVEQNGVSVNLDTFQLRPEDWFTICMKLVPLSREWRQLRPSAFGPVHDVVRNILWMEATTAVSLRACSRVTWRRIWQ